MKNDSFERKGYEADLMENNDENNLHHAIRVASVNELRILSGCISTNVNKSR